MELKPAVAQARKTIFEFRFRATLNFLTQLMPTAKKFEGYEHWETNGLNITFWDVKSRCNVVISDKKIAFEMDHLNALEEEKRRIGHILDTLPEWLELTSFSRVGLRRRYTIPVEMKFEELVSLMKYKLFARSEALTPFLPKDVDDVMFSFNFQRKGVMLYSAGGPVLRGEVEKNMGFNQKLHLNKASFWTGLEEYKAIVEGYPEVAVYFDVDAFKLDPDFGMKLDDVRKHKDLAVEAISETIDGLKAVLFGVELKEGK